MPGNLIYPFKHHTKLKDNFFRDLKFYRGRPLTEKESLEMQERLSQGPETWETGKSLFNDIYADFCMGLLSFTDEDTDEDKTRWFDEEPSPEIAVRLEKVIKSDETACLILAAYGQFLIGDFLSFMLRQKFSEEIAGELDDVYSWYFYSWYMNSITLNPYNLYDVFRVCNACDFYKQVIFACSHRFLYDYANAYGKDFAALLDKYFYLRNFPSNFFDGQCLDVQCVSDVLADFKFRIVWIDMDFVELAYESCRISIPRVSDLNIQDYLGNSFKKNLLEMEDEAGRSWIEENEFFSRSFSFSKYLPEIFRRMRGYYAKAREIWDSVDGYWLKGEKGLRLL